MGFAQHMITSLRVNNRRKKHISFEKNMNQNIFQKRNLFIKKQLQNN